MLKERFDCSEPPTDSDAVSAVPLVEGLSYRRLRSGEGESFDGMTFPALKHLLTLEPGPRIKNSNHVTPVSPFAFGAFDAEGRPAALALFLEPAAEQTQNLPELLSLFVIPEWRRQGVGSALLAAVEKDLTEAGFSGMRTVYTTGKSFQTIIEKMMKTCRWREPFVRMNVFQIHLKDLRRLTARFEKPRKGFEVSLWDDISDEEKQEMARQPWVPDDLTPKMLARNYDGQTSMALRYRGELIGWALTHRISEDMGRVTASFVRPDLARTGALIPMLAKSASIGWDLGYRRASFTAVRSHPKMTQFALRRLAKLCYYVGESRGAERRFTDN